MGLLNKKRALTAILANVSRLLLSVVLIVSGFVKAVDPTGLFYKLQEYLTAFGMEQISDGWIMAAAQLLPAAEFIVGVLLLMGVYSRTVTFLVFLFFLVFTPFTLVVALWNPVRDCGCFGDALHLSNWATFGKNIVLLLFATMVFFMRRLFVRKIGLYNRWMVALFALLYVASLEYVSMAHLPVLDFRPFAKGADLRESVANVPSVEKTVYRFEKDGDVREFDEENYPDSTWNYLGSRTDVIVEGRPAIIPDFEFFGIEDEEDYTSQILEDSGYVCMLIMNRVETADESRVDRINELYDYCVEMAVPFYAATASDVNEVDLWKRRTGGEYPVLWADDVMLKTIVRANPGVLLIKDGTVVGKWNSVDLPSVDEIRKAPTSMPDSVKSISSVLGSWKFWLFMFVAPLLFIMFVDVIIAAVLHLLNRFRLQNQNKEEKIDE